MPQVCHRQSPPENTPRLTNLGIVDFFNLGCGWLSRFSNHEDLVVGYILAKDKATVTDPLPKTISVVPVRTVQKILIIYGRTLWSSVSCSSSVFRSIPGANRGFQFSLELSQVHSRESPQ
jgi:hypothetical protein